MADDFVNPVSLFPSEGSQDLLPGMMHSLQGDAVNQDRAGAAQQFIKAQLQRLPQENQLKMMETQSAIGRQPMEDQKKKEQLRQEYSELQGKPVGKFVDDAAELWGTPGFKNKNPFQKAQAYGGMVAQWKQRHPGLQLPDELENYHPDTTDSHLQDAFNMKRYSSEFQQKQQLESEKTAGTVEASRIRGVEAAALRAEIMRELKASGQLKENPGQELSRIRRELNDSKVPAARKQELQLELEQAAGPLIEDQIRKKWGDESTALILGRGQPGFQEQRTAGMEKDRQAYRQAYGLQTTGPRTIDETDRVSVVSPDGKEGTVPRSKLDAYLKANPKAKKK